MFRKNQFIFKKKIDFEMRKKSSENFILNIHIYFCISNIFYHE